MRRLRALIDGVNAFGFNPATGGHNRIGYSDADMAAREWLADQMRADGLSVRRDGVANLFGRYGRADGRCIMAGSHLDTVPDGGAFDGVVGVCAALECVRAMRDAGVQPRYAIEVVATAEEEGRFGGMLGSQAISGTVTREWIDRARDADGVSLVEAMRSMGLNAYDALDCAARRGSVTAFLELHVEQGPVLEASGTSIGIAHSVAGVCNLLVRLRGTANHSGTTPMHLRADAFAGMTTVAHAIPETIKSCGGPQTRITIGKAEIKPNFIHTVPGEAEFVINIRDTDEAIIEAVSGEMIRAVERAAAEHRLGHAVEMQSRLAPVWLDSGLHAMLLEEADRMGLAAIAMPSGAGHDAQTMQALCPAGLIFVPSIGGISHAPNEWTEWDDIEHGVNLLLAALMRLAGGA